MPAACASVAAVERPETRVMAPPRPIACVCAGPPPAHELRFIKDNQGCLPQKCTPASPAFDEGHLKVSGASGASTETCVNGDDSSVAGATDSAERGVPPRCAPAPRHHLAVAYSPASVRESEEGGRWCPSCVPPNFSAQPIPVKHASDLDYSRIHH